MAPASRFRTCSGDRQGFRHGFLSWPGLLLERTKRQQPNNSLNCARRLWGNPANQGSSDRCGCRSFDHPG